MENQENTKKLTKFREKFMCPAPWSHIYYQINSPSPCHIIRNAQLNMTPDEYLKSDWLRNLKQEMLDGKIPLPCSNCKRKEDLGLKSTRGAFWNYYNMGPEPYYENQWFYNKLNIDTPTRPRRIELRFSNLCNMKCRMCDETSSSEWAKEKLKHDLPPHEFLNPNDAFQTKESTLLKITEDKIAGLKDPVLLEKLNKVCFTGGEPFLIKEYYEYLDFLLENNMQSRVRIETFTNCSVYNPLFVERLAKFRSVELVMSIDGVGPTAEYIRHGVSWKTVSENVRKFNALGEPFKPQITVAISVYTLLDVANLAKFLMELSDQNENISIKCYSVLAPGLNFRDAPLYLRDRLLSQIDQAIELLTANSWKVFRNELENIKTSLQSLPKPFHPENFFQATKQLDEVRGESFETTFGLPLSEA
jgi:MoaA/NifB/PqqE/SkfB family radical SAM enzyme